MIAEIESAITLLHVFDVPASLAFYRDILGFEVVNTSKPFTNAKDDFGWAMLRLKHVQLMINNAYEDNIRPAQPDPARHAAHADTILYLNCADVEQAFVSLRRSGVAVKEPVITYYGMKQVSLADPDGYGVCFQSPAETISPAE